MQSKQNSVIIVNGTCKPKNLKVKSQNYQHIDWFDFVVKGICVPSVPVGIEKWRNAFNINLYENIFAAIISA